MAVQELRALVQEQPCRTRDTAHARIGALERIAELERPFRRPAAKLVLRLGLVL
jgi:hypothetical protein